MPPDTGVDSTGFLDLTDVDNSKPAQNRRLLKSLQLLNLNMSFWRRKANFNANSNYQEDEVEKVSPKMRPIYVRRCELHRRVVYFVSGPILSARLFTVTETGDTSKFYTLTGLKSL